MKQDRTIPAANYMHVWRAAAAKVRAFIENMAVEDVVKGMYPDDKVTPIILRAASTQATLTDVAWAGPLAALSVSEAVQDSVSMSILGKLMAAGSLHIDLGNFANVVVPGRSTTQAGAGQWVAEGAPIPVRQYTLLGPTLRPRKLAVITTFSNEMANASNIEQILRALIIEAAGPAIDAAILSAAASSTAKSAGLFNGLVALTPATGTSAFDNCGQDLGSLIGDIATRNGGANALIVASPAQATAIRFFSGGQFKAKDSTDTVIASAGLPAGTVSAIEPSSFASTIGAPEFEVGTVAALHMEDTTPANIVGGSSPGTPAYPTKSMFQTDAIALKMTCWCDWCMRAPHVSLMNAVQW